MINKATDLKSITEFIVTIQIHFLIGVALSVAVANFRFYDNSTNSRALMG